MRDESLHRRIRAGLVGLVLALALAACGEWQGQSGPRADGSSATAPASVTVQKGDTIYGIARRYGLPVRDVIAANKLAPPYKIAVGQRLKLPRARYHVVERGDTIYNISRRYGVAQSALISENKIAAPYTVRVGGRLRLPAASTKAAAPGRATQPARASGKKSSGATARPGRSAAYPGGFQWPVQGRVVSRYGAKKNGLHNDGINIAAPRGTRVVAAEKGVVVYAGNELRGFGNLLLIKHSKGWVTAYAHNDKLLVSKGQSVRRGQAVAKVGSSGTVSKPQLHFEVRKGNQAVDPVPLLAALPAEMAAVR